MNINIIIAMIGASLATLPITVFPACKGVDPFVEFQNRFGGNQEFICAKSGGGKLLISVSMPGGDYDQAREIPRAEQNKLLSLYVYSGENKPVFSSWGYPKFGQSMKLMSLILHNGKSFIFKRFKDIPDPDADKKHFDSKPYFSVSIDDGQEMLCSQEWNSD